MKSTVFHRHRLLRQIFGRPRLLLCGIVGVGSFAVMPDEWKWSTRLLITWNIGVWLYLALAGFMMMRANEQSLRRRAVMVDESRFVVLGLTIVAAAASVAAIVAQLGMVKEMHGLLRYLHVSLAAVTILSAWTFIHVIFAQHYAHEYFIERDSEKQLPEDMRGGLRFPGSIKPDFSDFVYFSFVIGVATQTADVEICSRPMRRVALAHGVVSFFFNTIVVALTINIAAGLI